MNDRPPAVQLPHDRVEEIRDLAARLRTRPADEGAALDLLALARTALDDLLADRDDLVRANAAAGEELALWRGHA
ncbi:hypothetical protein [Streptomyces sp. MNU103]|uniref:hypothetical protein n=1 Tax=Streptomyces sp. MNU103 TaxID=2560024 RepID=UPI001E294271|nr:hypothetical protein [Streptomyces sp. MNU103]